MHVIIKSCLVCDNSNPTKSCYLKRSFRATVNGREGRRSFGKGLAMLVPGHDCLAPSICA